MNINGNNILLGACIGLCMLAHSMEDASKQELLVSVLGTSFVAKLILMNTTEEASPATLLSPQDSDELRELITELTGALSIAQSNHLKDLVLNTNPENNGDGRN